MMLEWFELSHLPQIFSGIEFTLLGYSQYFVIFSSSNSTIPQDFELKHKASQNFRGFRILVYRVSKA